MLIEIFTDRIYEETVCDPKNGIRSRRVPSITISEGGDTMLRDKYLKASKFLISALDNDYYGISRGGYYMLEVEKKCFNDSTTISAGNMKRDIPETAFSFKFNFLRDTIDADKNITIHGKIIIDDRLNVVFFNRDRLEEAIDPVSTIYTTKIENNPTSTGDTRRVWDEHSSDCALEGTSSNPFDYGCQQEVPTDKDSEGAGSDTTENSEASVELSKNSFTVKKRVINVTIPDMKVGSVEGSSFSVDLEKQRRQDEFIKNLSRKISKRNSNSRAMDSK